MILLKAELHIASLIIAFLLLSNGADASSIVRNENCVCPRHNITYRCTAIGTAASFTVWSGTIMENNCEVSLSHRINFNTTQSCNNGEVRGRGLSINGDTYTSELTVFAREDLQGRTISCSVDYIRNVTLLDIVTLNFTVEPCMPPTDVRLADASPHILVFEWSRITDYNCPSLLYSINAHSCGNCKNFTSGTSTTCTDFSLPSNCTLTVSSEICGNITLRSPASIAATALFKVPDAPEGVEIIPYYLENGIIDRVVTTFLPVNSFNISPLIDGSARNYTISYSDSNGHLCASGTLLPSSCNLGVCTHEQQLTQCSDREANNIEASIFATNVLGVGDSTTLSDQTFSINNNFVSVTLLANTRGLNCTFLERPDRQPCTCAISITYNENCDMLLGEFSATGPTDPLIITVSFRSDVQRYCFFARGTCGEKIAVIEGVLNIGRVEPESPVLAISLSVTTVIIFKGILAIIAALSIAYAIHKKKSKTPEESTLSAWMIHFSNEPTARGLADVLRVFKNLDVNITRINIPWQKNDDQPTTHHTSRIHFDCTAKQKTEIEQKFGRRVNFVEDHGGEGATLKTAEICFKNEPGSLLKLLEYLQNLKDPTINFRGLNTSIRSKVRSHRVNNFVTCLCSLSTVEKLLQQMENAGARDLKAELASIETRKLRVYVQEGVGNLRRILKVVAVNNIRLIYINEPNAPDDSKKTRENDVECCCPPDKIEDLKAKLKEQGAMNVQHQYQSLSPLGSDHVVLDFTVQDEFGSLIRVLEAFDHDKCNIDIIGLNTRSVAKEHLEMSRNRHYFTVTIECEVSDTYMYSDGKLLDTLKRAGYVRNPRESRCADNTIAVTFSIIDLPHILAEVLYLLKTNKHCKSLVSVTTQPRSEGPKQVVYRKNELVLCCSDETLKRLITDLNATCLAIEVEVINVEDRLPESDLP